LFTVVFNIILSMTQFPWKLLLLLLAKNGMVLSGYPPILMPGEIRGTNKTKAIADLVSTEQLALATALGANGPTKYRIRLRRVAKDKIDGKFL
jgi:hypothetical protein